MKKLSLLSTIVISLVMVAVVSAAGFWAENVVSSSQGPAYSGSISALRSDPLAVLGSPDNNGSEQLVITVLDSRQHFRFLNVFNM